MDMPRAGQFPGTEEGSFRRPGPGPITQRPGENEDENLREECSSTESQHQEVRSYDTDCDIISMLVAMLLFLIRCFMTSLLVS